MRTLFEISRSGLKAAERSLSVTSNNVVNADTPGYSRQRVNRSPVGMQMQNHHAGLGVNISSVSRLRDEMNDDLIKEKRQEMGYMQGKSKVYHRLEASMASDSGGDLDLRLSRLLDSFSELSSDPQDMSVRNNLVSEAEQLTNSLKEMDRSLNRESELVKDSAVSTVEQVNHLLKDLASINESVRHGQAQNNPNHTSLDLQVSKLEELSRFVDFESRESGSGAVEIRIGGVIVLNEGEAAGIKAEADDIDKNFRLRLENGKTIRVQGGKLGSEIEMYEEGIPELSEGLNQIAGTLVNEFNAVHSQGYGLEDDVRRDFFAAGNTRASDISLNDEIRNNVHHIAASSVDGEAGNGQTASEIAGLTNAKIVGGRRLIDYSIDLISTPGTYLSQLASEMDARESEIHMLELQQEQEAGVNIDEELSLLINYQNAYQGAARMMTAAGDMYDTLLSITR